MAHYVAELIESVRAAPPELLPVAQERCAAAILELWTHRAALPERARPFEDLKPVVETLKALNPDRPYPFYQTNMWRRLEEERGQLDEAVAPWLKLAAGADLIARLLIDEAIARAVAIAAKDSQEWADLAEAATGRVERDGNLIIQLLKVGETRPQPLDEERKRLRDRLERIDTFLELALILKAEIERTLAVSSA